MDEQRREEMTEQGSEILNAEEYKETPEIPQENPPLQTPIMNSEPRTIMPQQMPVQNVAPDMNAPRSQYPPNVAGNTMPYQNQAYQQWYAQNNPQIMKPKKKKNVGLIVFLISLAAIVTIAITAIIVSVIVGNNSIMDKEPNDGDYSYFEEKEEDVTVNEDGPELEIQDGGKNDDDDDDIEIKDGKVLTATQIAKKADKISVGVLVYSENTDKLQGEGTGILMSLDDKKEHTYVITCAHVVDGTNISVMVQTNQGESYAADIVGADSRTDIAVLRIKTNKLECAVFGNSDKLKVGDTVYAIGNPGGTEFFGSFTNGMVSAIDRPVNSEIGYAMKCIQHTAPINSGNSGGALLNSYGQVIGINSAKIIATGFEGMGFSIPITDAKEIVDELIRNGRVTGRAKLGISYYTASNSEKSNMIIRLKDLPAGSLIIGEIGADSDLANKDVEINDIIIAVDGKKLTESSILLEKIENGKVGDELKLTIVRFDSNYNMKKFDVTVKLVEDTGTTTTTIPQEEPTTSFYFNPFG